MTRFEDVRHQTTEEYFEGNQFSIDAFNKKYALMKGETYVESIKRVCDYMASCEATKELQTKWSEQWFDEIYNDWWHPSGSIMQGAGSAKKISLSNCTTVSLGTGTDDDIEWDSLEGIIRNATYNVAKMAAYRQGLGLDFSKLRPAKMSVMNSASETVSAVHWMKLIDSIGNYVGQKGRVPAMLFSLSCDHPDIEEFIGVKADYTKIQNANISVQCSDKFYDAVEKDLDWDLRFDIPEKKVGEKVYVNASSIDGLGYEFDAQRNKWFYICRKYRPAEAIVKTVKAKELMKLIAKNMFLHAEPGIQNIDVARKYSNSDYVYNPAAEYDSRICSSNACSEQYLSDSSCCILASLNPGRFSVDPFSVNEELSVIAPSMNRFLDNVNEMEVRNHTYATPLQRIAIENLRRTGAGFTNMCAWLFKQHVGYGTPEGNILVEEFMKQYNYYLYKASIALGKEKGSFKLFDRAKFEKSPFVQRMMKLGLEFEAMRNVTCSSIAPTGTLTLMFRGTVLSYGIEPPFDVAYWKRTRMHGKYEYYFCVPSIVKDEFAKAGIDLCEGTTISDTWDGKFGKKILSVINEHKDDIMTNFRKATDIAPMEKMKLMASIAKWCDSSISVTYLLPETTTVDEVYEFILAAHKNELKSIAAFPDKQMYGIISFMPFKELAVQLVTNGYQLNSINLSSDELAILNKVTSVITESVTETIVKSTPPKRPKSLNCDVHHVKFTKKPENKLYDYCVFVGLIGGDPYEVFVMNNGTLPKKYTSGILTKEKTGVYSVKFADGMFIPDITEKTTETEDVFTRMTSISLRHGADIKYVVEQLEKAEGDMWSFGKATARALKRYIPDGTKIKGECPKCGGSLIRHDGCKTCSNCEWSACV